MLLLVLIKHSKFLLEKHQTKYGSDFEMDEDDDKHVVCSKCDQQVPDQTEYYLCDHEDCLCDYCVDCTLTYCK